MEKIPLYLKGGRGIRKTFVFLAVKIQNCKGHGVGGYIFIAKDAKNESNLNSNEIFGINERIEKSLIPKFKFEKVVIEKILIFDNNINHKEQKEFRKGHKE